MFKPPYNSFEKLVSDEVIFFIRIRGKKDYFKNQYSDAFLAQFSSVKNFRCISEYKKDADVFIDLNLFSDCVISEEIHKQITKEIDVYQVIRRCRGLRSIPWVESFNLIVRAYLFFEKFYRDSPRLKLLVSGAVDNYVMDIMFRTARFRGVIVLPITSFLLSPQHKLVSGYGEYNDVNEPTDGEVKIAIIKIKESFESRREKKISVMLFGLAYSWLSYVFRFLFRYILRYKLLGQVNYEYRFFRQISNFTGIVDLFYYLKLGNINFFKSLLNRKMCYIPLHVYPEATTDYWIKDEFHSMHLNSLESVIDKMVKLGYTVVLKEHPFYPLGRPWTEYKRLLRDNVVILKSNVSSKLITDNVEFSVVWNGSTGVELCLCGKKVLFVVESYYNQGATTFSSEPTSVILLQEDEKFNFIKKVLRSSIRMG